LGVDLCWFYLLLGGALSVATTLRDIVEEDTIEPDSQSQVPDQYHHKRS
jgi:hypothetical protein